jgi:hypothetical protein
MASLSGPVIAGCSDANESEDQMEIDVMSVSDFPHTIEVTVYNDDGVLFEKVYELDASEGDSSKEIRGEPSEVHVNLTNGTSEQFDFRPPSECENAENDPKVVLTIYNSQEVTLTYGCTA